MNIAEQHPNIELITAVEAHKTTLENLVLAGSHFEYPALVPCELYPSDEANLVLAQRLPAVQSKQLPRLEPELPVVELPYLQIHSRSSLDFPQPDFESLYKPAVAASLQPRPATNDGWSVTVAYEQVFVEGTDHFTLTLSEGGADFDQTVEKVRQRLQPVAVYVGRTTARRSVILDYNSPGVETFTLLPVQGHELQEKWPRELEPPTRTRLRKFASDVIQTTGTIHEPHDVMELANQYYMSGYSD